MAVNINLLYPFLQQYTDNNEVVEVSGSTVSECINDLIRQYPDVKGALFDNEKLRSYFMFFVNKEWSSPIELSHPVKDGDELSIAVIIAGG